MIKKCRFFEMRKTIFTLCFLLIPFASVADELLQNISGKISEYAAGLIPGEGITEVNIELKEKKEPSFSVLGVRDVSKTENSNLFTQFSILHSDVGGDERYTGNLGLGYRFLTNDESIMLGVNSFYDADLTRGHERGSIGLEARGAVLEFNLNQYYALTNKEEVRGVDEQVLGGIDYSLFTQIPYMPWVQIGWTGYEDENDKASIHTEGDIYSVGMALNPTLQLDLKSDQNNNTSGDGDVNSANLTFIYPPRENKPTLVDGFVSSEMWYKESMKEKLSEKVKRQNNLTVEIQGAVIFTKK